MLLEYSSTCYSVLVYPHSGPGALNITNGDLKRLEPSEFLNDTLIELGLKCVFIQPKAGVHMLTASCATTYLDS